MALGGVNGAQSTITIGPAATARQMVIMRLGTVNDLSITSKTPVRSITATTWLDTNETPDSITAPWLGMLTTRGDKKTSVAGNFSANLTLTDSNVRQTLGKVQVSGTLADVLWDIQGNVGQLAIGHWGTGSTVMVGVVVGAGQNPFDPGVGPSGAGGSLGKISIGNYDTNNSGNAFGIVATNLSKMKIALPFVDGDFRIVQV